jgi:NAD(P) transhydrogenase subunit alpha
MDEEMRQRQARAIHETLKKQDIAICTALVPGRKAPVLITDAMLADMKPGSIVVDLAVEQGGNCEGSEPDKIVPKYGVKIVGWRNVPGRLAEDASAMYARNLLNFLTPFAKAKNGTVDIDWNDEVVKGCLVTRDGEVVHPQLNAAKAAAQ